MLKGNPDAWVWYSKAPEGFAYQWTHPPMAVLLQVTSMWLVGDSPFGWRLSGALLGLGSVIFVYLIGVTLFRNRTVGLLLLLNKL